MVRISKSNVVGTSIALLVGMLGVALLVPAVGHAEVYVWRDETGTMHFADEPKHEGYKPYLKGARRDRGTDERTAMWSKAEILDEIRRWARYYRVDPKLIQTVVRAESAFNPAAVSSKGAMGLMQLMPSTAKRLGVDKPYDPVQNLRGGIQLLSQLLERFEGRVSWALAAYHAGEARVKRHAGIPPIDSTRNYVRKILKWYQGRDAERAR